MFATLAMAAKYPSVDEVFHVKSGTTHGGCDKYKRTLNGWWSDCQLLIDASMALITDAKDNPDSRQYLETFFKIDSAPHHPHRSKFNLLPGGGGGGEAGYKPVLD